MWSRCCPMNLIFIFMFPAPTVFSTLSLHDALPICVRPGLRGDVHAADRGGRPARRDGDGLLLLRPDRKSTRLNSSHVAISYAVFCLKKKRFEAFERSEHVVGELHRIGGLRYCSSLV